MSVCLSVCVSVCVCVSVYTITKKNNDLIHLKLEHIVLYENSSDELDIGHCPIKGVTLKFFSIYYNTNCKVLHLSFGET